MKIAAFMLALLIGVPVVAAAALSSRAARSLILFGLLLSPALGTKLSINLLSMEWYRGPDRGFEICATDLAALGLLAAQIVRPGRGVRWFPPGTVPLALLAGFALVSALGSPVPLATSFTFFKAARCALVYWVVVNALIHEETLATLGAAWTAMGWLVGGLALFQKYAQGYYRVPGPFDHSNTIPLYLNLVLSALVVYALVAPGQRGLASAAQGSAALAMGFAVLATFSRAGMLLSALSIAGALVWVNLRVPSRRSLAAAVTMAVLGAAVGIKAAPSIIKRFAEAPEASAAAREEFNVAAQMMAADHPLGVGLNAFSHVMTVNSKYREHLVTMANEEHAGVAHHIYWLTAAELGYTGMALFTLVLAWFLARAARTALASRRPESLVAGGLLMGCCCLHISGFFEWALRITPVSYQFTMVCATLIALDCRLADSVTPATENDR